MAAAVRGYGRLFGDPHLAELTVHLPRHPEEQYTACQGHADDCEQLHSKICQQNPQTCGSYYAEDDGAAAAFGREPSGSHSNDDRIVAGEHHFDDDHRQQRTELIYAGQHPRHIGIAACIVEATATSKFAVLPRQPAFPRGRECAALARYLAHLGWVSA